MFKKSDLNYKNLHPFYQGGFVFLLITFISVFCLIIGKRNIHAWNLLLAPLLLFCVYNPIIGAFRQQLLPYLFFSILVFAGLIFYIYVSGNFISNVPYQQTDELHTIALLVILFYVLFNLLCLIFRGILHMLNEIDN